MSSCTYIFLTVFCSQCIYVTTFIKCPSESLQPPPIPLKRCFPTFYCRIFSFCCLPIFFHQNPPTYFWRAKRQTKFQQIFNSFPTRHFPTSNRIPSFFPHRNCLPQMYIQFQQTPMVVSVAEYFGVIFSEQRHIPSEAFTCKTTFC